MSPPSPPRSKPDRDALWIAWALTLALHAAAVLAFRHLPASQQASASLHRPEPVQLVFEASAPPARTSEAPHFFSELPRERADKAPVHPDFLSNVTSRARDLVPGHAAALPKLSGEGDAPTVKLESRGGPSRPSTLSPPAPQPAEPAASRAVGSAQPARPREQDLTATGGPRDSLAKPREDPARDASDRVSAGSAGNSDLDQPEMSNPEGSAALTGEVSLNTIAWDYAPWLQRFERQLLGRWFAPQAYYLGILKEGGWAVVEVEISPAGKMLRLELLEQQGHPSLILAAQNAVRSMAPIEPLPKNFPEPTLILRIRMIYPKIRPR